MGQECPLHMNRKCYTFDAATDVVESELLKDPLGREWHDSWILYGKDSPKMCSDYLRRFRDFPG